MSHLTYLKTCFKNFRYLDKALKQLNVNQKQTDNQTTRLSFDNVNESHEDPFGAYLLSIALAYLFSSPHDHGTKHTDASLGKESRHSFKLTPWKQLVLVIHDHSHDFWMMQQ